MDEIKDPYSTINVDPSEGATGRGSAGEPATIGRYRVIRLLGQGGVRSGLSRP